MEQPAPQPALAGYPDVLTVLHLREILGIGRNTAYELLREGKIKHVKVGRKYIVSKASLIKFINSAS